MRHMLADTHVATSMAAGIRTDTHNTTDQSPQHRHPHSEHTATISKFGSRRLCQSAWGRHTVEPLHACADSIDGIFRSASAASAHLHTTFPPAHTPFFPDPSAQQMTGLPAAFNRNSPHSCGGCRQPLVSASSLVCRHTHAKKLFTAEPDENRGLEEGEKDRDVPSGEPNSM